MKLLVSEKRWKKFASTTCKDCCPPMKLQHEFVRQQAKWKQQAALPADSRVERHQGSKKKWTTTGRKHWLYRHNHRTTQNNDSTKRMRWCKRGWRRRDSKCRCRACQTQRHPRNSKEQEVKQLGTEAYALLESSTAMFAIRCQQRGRWDTEM